MPSDPPDSTGLSGLSGAAPSPAPALDDELPGRALELWALGPALKLSDHLAEIERMLTPVG